MLLIIIIGLLLVILNKFSYNYLKSKIIEQREWDLNICCGETDGGGFNADIVDQEVSNFVKVDDIYSLPFGDQQFDNVLCSHTLEHVKYPRKFYSELQRVGRNVTIVLPPLWDIGAVLNLFEHKWIFLTFKKKHRKLPEHIKLPFAWLIHKYFGQIISA